MSQILIQFVFFMTYEKISKLESVNEKVIEVSCSHIDLNIIY